MSRPHRSPPSPMTRASRRRDGVCASAVPRRRRRRGLRRLGGDLPLRGKRLPVLAIHDESGSGHADPDDPEGERGAVQPADQRRNDLGDCHASIGGRRGVDHPRGEHLDEPPTGQRGDCRRDADADRPDRDRGSQPDGQHAQHDGGDQQRPEGQVEGSNVALGLLERLLRGDRHLSEVRRQVAADDGGQAIDRSRVASSAESNGGISRWMPTKSSPALMTERSTSAMSGTKLMRTSPSVTTTFGS